MSERRTEMCSPFVDQWWSRSTNSKHISVQGVLT